MSCLLVTFRYAHNASKRAFVLFVVIVTGDILHPTLKCLAIFRENKLILRASFLYIHSSEMSHVEKTDVTCVQLHSGSNISKCEIELYIFILKRKYIVVLHNRQTTIEVKIEVNLHASSWICSCALTTEKRHTTKNYVDKAVVTALPMWLGRTAENHVNFWQ